MKETNPHDIMQSCFDALEEERRSLAHELHDEIGQSLTAIRTSAKIIARQSEGRQSYDVAQGIVSLTDGMFDLLHNMLHRLHPTVLDKLGLIDALSDLSDFNQKHCSLKCNIHTEGGLESLSLPMKLTVYRIVQEALNNASRHGAANCANIHICLDKNALHITVDNNGSSLDESRLKEPGIGILGMKQRIIAFDGKLEINNKPSGGVIVHVELPLNSI